MPTKVDIEEIRVFVTCNPYRFSSQYYAQIASEKIEAPFQGIISTSKGKMGLYPNFII